jgi:hypothetical protein
MPIVFELQSAVELRLANLGSAEFVSIVAELVVAGLIFGSLAAFFAVTNWLVKQMAASALENQHSQGLRNATEDPPPITKSILAEQS